MSGRARDDRDDDQDDSEVIVASVPGIHLPLKQVSSSLVRDWVRATLVPEAVRRMYNIGMGVTKFDVPTMAGNVVSVPAPANVQRAALHDIISIGVPPQIGLTPDDPDEVPGVLALGEWELARARGDVHEPERDAPRLAGGIEVPEAPESAESSPSYVPPEGHEAVVVDEDGAEAARDLRGELPPPPPDPDRNALAKAFLAKRRAAREPRRMQPKAGDHPNHE